MHELGEPDIRVESPEIAGATWPFTDRIDERRDGSGLYRRGWGRYDDRYVMVRGRWLITDMRITRERVQCEVYVRGELSRWHTCLSQEQLIDWLRRERGH